MVTDQTTYEARFQSLKDMANHLEQCGAPANLRFPNLTLFTDPQRTPDPALIINAMPAGSGVIYRHFGAPNAQEVAKSLREITHLRGITLLIGNDIALSDSVFADGVHFSQSQCNLARDYRRAHTKALISVACHDLDTLMAFNASALDFDAVFISPVFPSLSPSAQHVTPLGLEVVKDWVKRSSLPLYGLGGIRTDNIQDLFATGLRGAGGIDLFLD